MPLDFDVPGSSHRHDALLGAGEGRDADLRVDVEHGRLLAAGGPRGDADAGQHVVVVLVRSSEVLLEDHFLRVVAREGVARTASTRLALGERGVTGEAGLDDGEPGREE